MRDIVDRLRTPATSPNWATADSWMIEAAQEIESLRKDAERYRWLRSNPQWLGWEHDFRPDEVEREIDAAMGKP